MLPLTLLGTLDLGSVQEIERLALHAWPAWEVASCRGWLLRYAAGVTRRANSVWPQGRDEAADVECQLEEVEAFYHARRLPARYQICPAMEPRDLDQRLSERGYVATARTAVQTATLAQVRTRLEGAALQASRVAPVASEMWWACYAAADGAAPDSVAARQAICAKIQVPVAYAMILHGGEPVAVGSAAVEAGWIGIFNIATRPEFRRQGAARALVASLAEWGAEQGAINCYLQVMADNVAAQRLYGQLGFTTGYYYHYREEVGARLGEGCA